MEKGNGNVESKNLIIRLSETYKGSPGILARVVLEIIKDDDSVQLNPIEMAAIKSTLITFNPPESLAPMLLNIARDGLVSFIRSCKKDPAAK